MQYNNYYKIVWECIRLNNIDLLNNVKKIHFVGIGGSGMCPMAEILNKEGFEITGSDIYESDTLERIRALHIPVYIGHKKENVLGKDLIVYTAAVKRNNPELLAAQEFNIPAIERSVMLGLVTKGYSKSIAVSGTHGKTSTTAMITQILTTGKADPTAIIGGKLPFIGGNSRVGKSDIIVCEACEYVDTFLQLHPYISVILNIDADHLDYFGSLENIKKSFNKFGNQTSGLIIYNGDDKNSVDTVNDINIKKLSFGLNENNDYYAKDITTKNGAKMSFSLIKKGQKLCDIKLNVPGKHNIYNALAAAVVADYLSIDTEFIKKALSEFTGVHRRFEILGNPNDIVVADDFAHHPTEITAILNSAMSMGFNTVWAVFQPHTYSRTAILINDFAKALSIADKVIISEILAVREENTYNIYSKDLGEKVSNSVCIDSFEDITEYIKNNAKPGDLVLTMGGGNVYKCANMILKSLNE